MNLRSLLNRCLTRLKICNPEENVEFETQGQSLSSYNSRYRRNFKLESFRQVETVI